MKVHLNLDKQSVENIVKRKFARLNNRNLEVGYLDNPELEFIASIQEHGAVIPVTQKMRYFLGLRHNIWLSKDKTHIVIPQRPFMHVAFEANKSKYANRLMKFYAITKNVHKSIELLGESVIEDVQHSINQYFVPWKDNSDMTILLKGFNRPLVKKGSLLTDVTYRINK